MYVEVTAAVLYVCRLISIRFDADSSLLQSINDNFTEIFDFLAMSHME